MESQYSPIQYILYFQLEVPGDRCTVCLSMTNTYHKSREFIKINILYT